jgi:hypothetical protein
MEIPSRYKGVFRERGRLILKGIEYLTAICLICRYSARNDTIASTPAARLRREIAIKRSDGHGEDGDCGERQ